MAWKEKEQKSRLKQDSKDEEHVPGRGVEKALEPGVPKTSAKTHPLEGCCTGRWIHPRSPQSS